MSSYIDSKTPRGPQRWLRALNNWETNPDSHAADLFGKRLALAQQVQHLYGDDWNSRAFLKKNYHENEWKVDFYTCSKFCASMQVQLEFHNQISKADAELWDALIVDYRDGNEITDWRKVELRWPTKEARCQTCGRSIHSDAVGTNPLFEWPNEWQQGWQDDAAQDATPEPEQDSDEGTTAVAVDEFGNVVDLTTIQVVRLTDRERELFLAVHSAARRTFAMKHGISLGL